MAYWNYGMRYAFMFLLSLERALGRRHSAFESEGTRRTIYFPLDFAPYGLSCGFGDIGDTVWTPVAVHYAAAERMGALDVIACLDAVAKPDRESSWPTSAEILALHPRVESRSQSGGKGAGIKLYSGIGWARAADSWPRPHFYVSVRGGHTRGPHNSADLLSWHALVDGRRMIWSCTNHEYLDTTFSDRRFDMAEMRPDTKNTILIGGVGMSHPGEARIECINISGFDSIRVDATSAYRLGYCGCQMARFVGRLFTWLNGAGLIVLDTVELEQPNRIESRIHTHAEVKVEATGVEIRSGDATLRLAFAASAPAILAQSFTAPTNPQEEPARVIRWATRGVDPRVALGMLAAPDCDILGLDMLATEERIVVNAKIGARAYSVEATWHLLPECEPEDKEAR